MDKKYYIYNTLNDEYFVARIRGKDVFSQDINDAMSFNDFDCAHEIAKDTKSIIKCFEEIKPFKSFEEILAYEKAHRYEDGEYGIKACKETILRKLAQNKKWNKELKTNKHPDTLEKMLENFVYEAQTDAFFNSTYVLACYELINEKKEKEN